MLHNFIFLCVGIYIKEKISQVNKKYMYKNIQHGHD